MSFFNNFGMVALIYIYTMQWGRGLELDEGVGISIMAMVFYLFM